MAFAAEPAVIEIVERRAKKYDPAHPLTGIVVPNEIRINGTPLLCSADDPVTVHGISTLGHDVVRVTLTLFARRVFIGAESDL